MPSGNYVSNVLLTRILPSISPTLFAKKSLIAVAFSLYSTNNCLAIHKMVPLFYLDPAVQLKVLLQAWGKHCITSVVRGSQFGWRLVFGLSATVDTSLLHQLTHFGLRTWLPAVYLCNVVGSVLWWTWLYPAGQTPWRAASSLNLRVARPMYTWLGSSYSSPPGKLCIPECLSYVWQESPGQWALTVLILG